MIINSQKKIDFFKRYFAKKNLVCVDTEFERKKTYFSRLSIILLHPTLPTTSPKNNILIYASLSVTIKSNLISFLPMGIFFTF